MSGSLDNYHDQYAKSVCLFLAELLRTHKISLGRAAEIAQKVVDNINLIDSEHDFLRLIKELSSDFDELFGLQERIQMNIHVTVRKELENKVREFVIFILPQNSNLALAVLQEAIKDNVRTQDLCDKFYEFKEFITQSTNARPG